MKQVFLARRRVLAVMIALLFAMGMVLAGPLPSSIAAGPILFGVRVKKREQPVPSLTPLKMKGTRWATETNKLYGTIHDFSETPFALSPDGRYMAGGEKVSGRLCRKPQSI